LAAPHHFVAPGTSFSLNVTSESVSDLSGGLSQGTVYDTLVDASFGLGTQNLGLWDGGWFWLDLQHITSGDPSGTLVGDFQGVSNIAAPSGNRVYEFWFRQYLGHTDLKLRAGYIDLNNYFAQVPYADQISNASLGIIPTISGNAPTSTYAKPGAGMILSDGWGDWVTEFGLFQGHPENRGQLFGHGYMAIAEIGHQAPSWANPTQTLKLGVWQYSQPDPARDGGPASTWGTYVIMSQQLAPLFGATQTHVFAQIGASPPQVSISPYYLGGGLALQGLVPNHPQDILSTSISRAWVRTSTGLRPETSYEINYLWNFGSHFALQPDLQYVTQPAGTSRPVPDAFVAILRLYAGL
ncbi:MAG: carbohydrate porin, partial [Gammaproteobacteria bacterium]